jgi:hypothetical protein
MDRRDYFEIQHADMLIEICCCRPGPLDGALLGYAIKFAGGWDGWLIDHPNHRQMTKVAINTTREAAVKAVGGETEK